MRISLLFPLPLFFLACERAPDQPNAVAALPAFAVTNAKKVVPTLKAAGRIRAECGGGLAACTGYNIVSVTSGQGLWLVTVDPSIDLSTSVVMVTPDTLPAVASLTTGGAGFPSNTLGVSMLIFDGAGGVVAGQTDFSLLVY